MYNFYKLLKSKVWIKKDNVGIDYSDGDDTENYLYDVVRKAKDKSVFSKDLIAAIKDWPSYYYFSPIRTNLLRPVEYVFKGRGLEIGCGCGALTRYLGELGGDVVALEGSRRRGEIAALRCNDLKNVNVVVENVIDFHTTGFDWATLIGVLEYAPKFIKTDDPVKSLLTHIYSLLNDNGTLVIAIENLIGLKYLAGSGEDHYGLPFFGINNSYPASNTKTFTKKYLCNLLKKVGFKNVGFLYPFPDYKQPKVVVSERAVEVVNGEESCAFQASDLARIVSQNCYGKYDDSKRTFSEEIAWNAFIENGNLSDVSNSFLIVANKNDESSLSSTLVYEFSTEAGELGAFDASFVCTSSEVKIQRHALSENVINNDLFEQRLVDESLPSGEGYLKEFYKMLNAPNWTINDVVQWAKPWKRYLESVADNSGKIPAYYYNCYPQNIIIDSFGTISPYNLIWHYKRELTVDMVISRGIIASFLKVADVAYCQYSDLTLLQIIDQILKGLSVKVDLALLKQDLSLEAEKGFSLFSHIDDVFLKLDRPLQVRSR